MPLITFQGANRMIVRRNADVLADPDWIDPTVAITDAAWNSEFWGCSPHRGGGLGPLKQLGLDVVFFTAAYVEVAGVTFDYYTYDVITREEVKAPQSATGRRHFVRKTGAGTAHPCGERLTVDVNGSQAMGLRLSNIVDGSATATNYIILATEIDYR
jgi:hypothetical protein